MIRIGTTDIQVGDHIITSAVGEGTVTAWRGKGLSRFMVHMDTANGPVRTEMRDCGSVELLSDLNGRTPCKSFGRW